MSFTDVDNVRYSIDDCDAIQFVSSMGIMSGYTDGSFRPEASITNAEICKLLCYLFRDGLIATSNNYNKFGHHWAKDYIYALESKLGEVGHELWFNERQINESTTIDNVTKVLDIFFETLIKDYPSEEVEVAEAETETETANRLAVTRKVYKRCSEIFHQLND